MPASTKKTTPVVATDYPPDCPEFRAWTQLRPRAARSTFKRKIGELTQLQATVQAAQDAGMFSEDNTTTDMTAKLNALADADLLFAAVDDLLEMVAKDPAAYRRWSDELDDDSVLTAVFSTYIAKIQPKESA